MDMSLLDLGVFDTLEEGLWNLFPAANPTGDSSDPDPRLWLATPTHDF